MKKNLLVIASLISAVSLSGCLGGKSDNIGVSGNKDAQSNGSVQNPIGKPYVEAFEPAREYLKKGEFDALLADSKRSFANLKKDEIQEQLIKNNSELSIVERGLFTLNSGDFENAVNYFEAAEKKDESNSGSSAGSFFKSAASVATGMGEVSDYEFRGYERVMMFNYNSIAHLLIGDTKATNIVSKASERQKAEHDKFDSQQAKNKAELEKAEYADVLKGLKPQGLSGAALKKANAVKNAYVNPLGDYLDGVIFELQALKDGAQISAAQIAYKKAAALNPKSQLIKDRVKALEKVLEANKLEVQPGKKLVHVIVADGFAPKLQEKNLNLAVMKYKASVNYAMPVEVPTKVTRVNADGKALEPLSPMSAIIYRDFEDHKSWRTLTFVTSLLTSAATGVLAEKGAEKLGFAGGIASSLTASATKEIQHADTRSWLSLPNTIYVGRFEVPASQKTMKISTNAASAGVNVPLLDNEPTIIYAVSYDKVLRAYASKKVEQQQ